MFRVENYLGEGFMANTFPQHDAAVQRYLGGFVSINTQRQTCVTLLVSLSQCHANPVFDSPFQQNEEDFLVGAEVLDCGAPRPDLPPQDVVKDVTNILFPLKTHRRESEALNPVGSFSS